MPAQAGTRLRVEGSWVPAFAGMTERVGRFTAAWGAEGKKEGMFPVRHHACMQWGVGGVFGTMPRHARRRLQANSVQWHEETQRFWPAKLTLANSMKGGALEPVDQTARSNALHG